MRGKKKKNTKRITRNKKGVVKPITSVLWVILCCKILCFSCPSACSGLPHPAPAVTLQRCWSPEAPGLHL